MAEINAKVEKAIEDLNASSRDLAAEARIRRQMAIDAMYEQKSHISKGGISKGTVGSETYQQFIKGLEVAVDKNMGLFNRKKLDIVSVHGIIKSGISTKKDSLVISGIEKAAKNILVADKEVTKKSRWIRFGIGALLIIAALAILKICPFCSKYIIANLPELLELILG